MSLETTLKLLKIDIQESGLRKRNSEELGEYVAALCHSQAYSFFGEREFPQIAETIRLYALKNHMDTLQDHITELNTRNSRIQKWVIALAVASLIGSFVQVGIAF